MISAAHGASLGIHRISHFEVNCWGWEGRDPTRGCISCEVSVERVAGRDLLQNCRSHLAGGEDSVRICSGVSSAPSTSSEL